MKKLMSLFFILSLTISTSVFAVADLCDNERDEDAKADLVDYKCTSSDVKNKVKGCESEGQVVKVLED